MQLKVAYINEGKNKCNITILQNVPTSEDVLVCLRITIRQNMEQEKTLDQCVAVATRWDPLLFQLLIHQY